MEEQKSSPLHAFSPKQIFLFGIASGFLVLCAIGFFVLLGLLLNGNGLSLLGAGNANAQPPAPLPTDDGTQPTAQISVRPVDENNDHVRGAKNARITIVEYSDFECPFCKVFHATMIQVLGAYPSDVRWVYRQFPLDSLHSQARQEAIASECAAEQGKFWEFADLIFKETTSNDGLDITKLPAYAGQVGVNVAKFNECLTSGKYATAVQEDEQDAQAAGARGTPYSVILGPNGEKIPLNGALPYAQVKAAIDSVLAAS